MTQPVPDRRTNEFEDAVIRALLAGDHPVLAQLRQQYERCDVRGRTTTCIGLFTDLAVPLGIPVTTPVANFHLGDVFLELAGLQHGAGAILFVRDGLLSYLDCHALGGEDWPEQPNLLAPPTYSHRPGVQASHGERDMRLIADSWSPANPNRDAT